MVGIMKGFETLPNTGLDASNGTRRVILDEVSNDLTDQLVDPFGRR
jgi:hypothetical protein